MTPKSVLSIIVPLTLAGCATPSGEFPSLERRPFEQNSAIEAPIVPPTPVATSLPADIAAKVDTLRARYRAAAGGYAAMLPNVRARANAAARTPLGSESWIQAQLLVSRLDKERSDAVNAAAAMDDLVVAQLDVESQKPIIIISPLLRPIQAEMNDGVAKQNQEIDQLSKIIGL
ncbi:hypothetical protein ACFOWX_11965 [Sphingorhabdus arenilitoris]|uniref:Lipoprotein n=2 Tax=Sphingorhabdus arenilitoris TaxID=1490041 RepID=A0ABV8RI87_9SPHN